MIFVSFQPYDWRTSERTTNGPFHEMYERQIGFNPMYAIVADELDWAAIGANLIVPITPEVAVFFKTKDYWLIDKIQHYQCIGGKADIPRAFYSRKIDEYCKDEYGVATDLIRLAPYKSEYLVNRNEIKVIQEVRIKDRLEKYSDEKEKSFKGELNKALEEYKKKFDFSKREEGVKRAIRNAEATFYFQIYAKVNDFFIEDYKKIIGTKDDVDVTTKNISGHRWVLEDNFNANPDKAKYDKLVDYLESVMYL